MNGPLVTASVVSHGQGALVSQLLQDIGHVCPDQLQILITENIPDSVSIATEVSRCPVQRIVNAHPLGFGANHNQAFQRCTTPFYCVLNPDIRLASNPFPRLIRLVSEPSAGVVGPLVRAPSGRIEDSARKFPTPVSLVAKLFGRAQTAEYPTTMGTVKADWIAGMFMLFRAEVFRAVGGFDEAFFLYYEDVDLCRRLRLMNLDVLYDPETEVVHDARRASRGDLRLMRRHVSSMLRYFFRY